MDIDKMQEKLAAKLKPRRFEHCIGVMEAAEKLALHYNVDVKKAIVAGLLHDCARCFDHERLIAEAKARKIPLSILEYRSPVLIHALLGGYIAREEYGVEDEEILQAIRFHTVAGANMTDLDKIIYLADMIEVHRLFPGVDDLRAKAETLPLDEVMLDAFDQSIKFIMIKKDAIHPNTIVARNEIILKRANHG